MVTKQFAFDLLSSKLENVQKAKVEEKVIEKKLAQPLQTKKKKEPKPIQREVISWTSYFFKKNKWFYFQKIVPWEMDEGNMQRLLKRSKLLHSRPVADIILAKIVSKRKLKKYKVWWTYDLPQSIIDLLCTFTR